ncbi:MAG: hypothetical protein ABI456_01650 [Ktedonobacteraceae bacterium]
MTNIQRDYRYDKADNHQGYDSHVPGNPARYNRAHRDHTHGGAQIHGDQWVPDWDEFYNDDTYAGDKLAGGGHGGNGHGGGGNGQYSGRQPGPLWQRKGLILFGLLLIGSILAALLLPFIEGALALPGIPMNARTTVAQPTVPALKNQNGVTPTPAGKTPITIAPTTNILSQDTFQRGDQLFWGTSSDGHPWSGDAMTKNAFAITGKTGQVSHGTGPFNATLGPQITDGEIIFTGSISQFNQSNIGAVLRWMDTRNWYKTYIDGTRLIILKSEAGMMTRLGAVPFTARPGSAYTLRFRVTGTTLAARVWQAGTREPQNWMVTVTDTTFQSGLGGLRLFLQQGITAKFMSFEEMNVNGNS